MQSMDESQKQHYKKRKPEVKKSTYHMILFIRSSRTGKINFMVGEKIRRLTAFGESGVRARTGLEKA